MQLSLRCRILGLQAAFFTVPDRYSCGRFDVLITEVSGVHKLLKVYTMFLLWRLLLRSDFAACRSIAYKGEIYFRQEFFITVTYNNL